MTPSVVVYTAITGTVLDKLREPAVPPGGYKSDVRFVCFSDMPMTSTYWDITYPKWEHADNSRRTARFHKIMSHELFPVADYTIWLDGTHQLLVDPLSLIERYMGDGHDIATFKHPLRGTVKEEIAACAKLKKDDVQVMTDAYNRMLAKQFSDDVGLYETSVVIRRNTPAVKLLNTHWWVALSSGSLRDQVSLPFALWLSGLKCNIIVGSRDKSPHFDFRAHSK